MPQPDSRQRAALVAVTVLAGRDLLALWSVLDVTRPDLVRDSLLDVLPELAAKWTDVSGSLALDHYEHFRDASGVRGRGPHVMSEPPPKPRLDALARWGVGPLFAQEPDPSAALSLVGGGLQRVVADGYRNTITSNSVADPRSRGWARTGAGQCDFCRMLIDRGAVYTEATADFASHDRCHCTAEPVFE